MKLTVVAVGRLKAGPERELAERYRARAETLGRSLGVSVEVAELPESRARREPDRMAEEADAILRRAGAAALVLFDERGRSLPSEAFAEKVGAWRDAGRPVVFVVGGPDGLAPSLRDKAELVLSFGALSLPHQLVRVLVLEQVYRSLTILSGHPYHRAGRDEA
ncbi:MAG TPA: 23S rRNA (pseudouridine(1915)-N(3))-methyltransferase RlmH [Beijerinckiaceae bacterium]|nr:23S rRNA (pseudouridine(1915)-N(3))-methyltransferase RlmH [Beijerinckiaceae bacterium]